jgi:hypothetical protein
LDAFYLNPSHIADRGVFRLGLGSGHDTDEVRVLIGIAGRPLLALLLSLAAALGLPLLPFLAEDFLLSLVGRVVWARIHSQHLPALAATAAESTVSIAAATTASARAFAGFTDGDRSALDVFAVQRLDGALRAGIGRHLDECEPTGPARVAIEDDLHLGHLVTHRRECLAQVGLGGRIRQVAYVEFLSHFHLLLSARLIPSTTQQRLAP